VLTLPVLCFLSYRLGLFFRWIFTPLPIHLLLPLLLLLVWRGAVALLMRSDREQRRREARQVNGFFLLVLISCLLLGQYGKQGSRRELQAALDAGLREDALALLADWPQAHAEEGRILPQDPAFAQLPESIRMLEPLYVTRESLDLEGPVNLGICKLGFGGFASGVRIFVEESTHTKSGPDRNGYRVRKEVAPQVYLWADPT